MGRNSRLLLATGTAVAGAGAYFLYPKYKPLLNAVTSSVSSSVTRILEGIESIEEEASDFLSTPFAVLEDHKNEDRNILQPVTPIIEGAQNHIRDCRKYGDIPTTSKPQVLGKSCVITLGSCTPGAGYWPTPIQVLSKSSVTALGSCVPRTYEPASAAALSVDHNSIGLVPPSSLPLEAKSELESQAIVEATRYIAVAPKNGDKNENDFTNDVEQAMAQPGSEVQAILESTRCITDAHNQSDKIGNGIANNVEQSMAKLDSKVQEAIDTTSCVVLAPSTRDENGCNFKNDVDHASHDESEYQIVKCDTDSEDCLSEDSQSQNGRSDTSSGADTQSSHSFGSDSSSPSTLDPIDAGMEDTELPSASQTATVDSAKDVLELSGTSGIGSSENEARKQNDDLEPFRRLIDDIINLDAFADMALRLRTHILLRNGKLKHGWGKKKRRLTCAIDETPLHGGFNLVYKVRFSDGVRWALRIPGYGNYGEEEYMDKMNSEYNTMRYIRSKTSIPMPEVYFWDASDEELGTAYAFMEWIEGNPLDECWFETEWRSEDRRLNLLTSIANYMAQLHALNFDQIGTLRFTDKGRFSHVDALMNLRGWEVAWEILTSVGPFAKPKDMLFDDWPEEAGERTSASLGILRLAIDSIPDFMFEDGKYPLSVNDFNPQNILVNKKGQIVSFIDWDEVAATPSCMGSARFPSWITRDWDPACYAWEPEGQDLEKYVEEDSPETLLRYRRHYSKAFAKAAHGQDGYDDRQTSLSHLVEAISIALGSTISRGWIVDRMLDHAFCGKAPFTLFDYTNAYENGTSEAQYDRMIKAAFQNMWDVKKHTYESFVNSSKTKEKYKQGQEPRKKISAASPLT